ncbi:MAG TPA: hemolysin family protein [Candidatus Thermoplasmatota archaeon]|nr:hemolysin family protein [Candidatus Thermoplasmatota archaeon]
MADLTYVDVAWRILAVILLVLLNGFFVASEFAIVKVRGSQLEALARGGDKRALRAQGVVKNLDAYLSATQLGITLASLGLGWIGEPAVASLIQPLVASVTSSEAVLHTVAFGIAFSIITFLHIVIGELAPKSLAIQKPQATTFATAAPLKAFYFVFRPFIWALNGTANALLRLFGIRPVSEKELAHSEEELRLLLAESGRARTLSRRRTEILLNVMDLTERTAKEIMVPRLEVTALSTTAPLAGNLRVARESGFTRFPLAKGGNVDEIVGMVHLKDLLWFSKDAAPDATIAGLAREIPAVPDSMTVEALLDLMLKRRAHMALVIDEHGGTAGIVTLEDVLEEFVGEIQDEFDTEEASWIRAVDGGGWLIEGSAPLHRVAIALRASLEDGDATTFGGFIVSRLGRVPTPGTELDFEGYHATVRSADRKRVKTVYVRRT